MIALALDKLPTKITNRVDVMTVAKAKMKVSLGVVGISAKTYKPYKIPL